VAHVSRGYTNVVTVSGQRSKGTRELAKAQAKVTATASSAVRVPAKVTTQAGVPSFTG
jgi:hypothetical protein